jgi:tRNA(fMet)-specific endonuclease VapC
LIEVLDSRSDKGDEALKRIIESGDSIGITAINLHELLYGLQKYAKPLGEVLQLAVLNYTKEDARLSAKLELGAEKARTPIRRTDAMIAATTTNNDATLYTLDMKHFKPLKSLGLTVPVTELGSDSQSSTLQTPSIAMTIDVLSLRMKTPRFLKSIVD